MADLLDRITINPHQCGGRPCVRGMRIRVTFTPLAHEQGRDQTLRRGDGSPVSSAGKPQ